jgi:topoisomerase IA-like protein
MEKTMSLKEKVEAMKVVMHTKACRHGYDLSKVIGTLYAYIAELEGKAAAPAPAKKAPAKKATAKKAPAKKAPAKKAPAKKTSKK